MLLQKLNSRSECSLDGTRYNGWRADGRPDRTVSAAFFPNDHGTNGCLPKPWIADQQQAELISKALPD
jgi:hypothetical protein